MSEKEMDKTIKGIGHQWDEEARAFMYLLDKQRTKEGHQFALSQEMGSTRSYVTSVSLNWLAANVNLAQNLPVWDRYKDKDGKVKIDAESIDELRQRTPDWSRQYSMSRYLATRKHHKFAPMLVVAWQEWANDQTTDQWQDNRAIQNSITEIPLDTHGAYVDLDCEKTEFFALDGQHRLIAVWGLRDLLENKPLVPKKKDGSEKSGGIKTTKEGVFEELLEIDPNIQPEVWLRKLMSERIGIEIIPAVQKDETYNSALQRLRTIFVHVNKTPKKLTKGELAMLDEDDGFSIVARRVMVKHKMLKERDRVETKRGQLRDTDPHYTTLETLSQIAKSYLTKNPHFKRWEIKEKGDSPVRPDEDELDQGVEKVLSYFDMLTKLPSHQDLIQNHNQSCEDYRVGKEGKLENIIFRPITQLALASAIGQFENHEEHDYDLDKEIIPKLIKAEKDGKLILKERQSIWFGVLCDVTDKNIRKQEKYKTLCYKLLLHLLGGGTNHDERQRLEEEYRDARKVDDEGLKSYGRDGEPVPSENLTLPEPW